MNPNRPVIMSILQYQDEMTSGQMTVFELLDKLASFGLPGIELRRELWPNYQAELAAVRDRLLEMGVFATFGTFSTLFSPDANARKMLLHDMETAKALGASLLRIFPGAAPADTNDPAWAKALEAVKYATSLGLVLALENFGRTPGGHLSEMEHIINHIDSPTLKTNIDIGNYATHGEDVLAAIRSIGHRAVYAHLKDKVGTGSDATTYLGGGSLPMHDIITALNALPQKMIYCFEFAGGGEAGVRIEKSKAYLQMLES